MELGDRLKILMKELDINQAQVADMTNVTRQNISNIINGKGNPSIEWVRKLVIAYPNINTKWFVTGEGEMLIDAIPGEKQNGDCPGSGGCENCKRLNDFIANQERLIDRLYNLLDNNRLGGGGNPSA